MKTIRLGYTDIGAILFAGLDDDNNLCSMYISVGSDGEFISKYATTIEVYQNANLNIIILINE